MNKTADMKLEVLAHELHAHCTKNDIPCIFLRRLRTWTAERFVPRTAQSRM